VSLPERIEQLCRRNAEGEVDELAARDAAVTGVLARILAGVRGGAPDPDQLTEDLDALEAAAVNSGLEGLTKSSRVFRDLPSSVSGDPLAHALLCPVRACARRQIVYGPDVPALECALTDRPLDHVRLDL
jgi:hypothetical protein